MIKENNEVFNILIEKNNTFAIKSKNINNKNFGKFNTSYFDFKNSIISIDVDNRYYNLSSGYRKQFSNIYKLEFGSQESLRFNIFDEIDQDTAYNDTFEIANNLLKNIDNSNAKFTYDLSDVRDFLILLILHVKCSDFRDKSLFGCLSYLNHFEKKDDTYDYISEFLDSIIESYHCSPEIHEIILSILKRFKNMNKSINKDSINLIYNKAISSLCIFQNTYLSKISSESDFCIQDIVINKPKSLYITFPLFDSDIYNPYIKIIIPFFIKKIKKYYSQNNFSINSVLLLIDECPNLISSPLFNYNFRKKNISEKNNSYKDKINLSVISTRKNLKKECKSSLIPDKNSRKWYHIPEEMYMQNKDIILEPLFTSRVLDEEELEESHYKYSTLNSSDDEKLKNLFKPTDNSSSVNKDSDYERNKNNIEIIFHRKIKQKELYYTQKNNEKIEELNDIFSYSKFNKIIDRLDKKDKKPGFICIFTGSPGTGKTETVYQLARACQRNIIKYDVTQISSGYIGVAVNKVKEIFDNYNLAVKNLNNHPILFLNEADSFFSRRMDISSDVNQVSCLDENRTQTILLEALEKFNGILIATTNLITNFDPAYERRFLYKIIFDKPDKNTRKKILENMMPELKDEECQYIINNYELTGAQIDNISSKLEIQKVIRENINFDDIKKLCKEEVDNSFSQVDKTIGF